MEETRLASQPASVPVRNVPPRLKSKTVNKTGGVGGVIFAAVVITLGLAALAAYAYLKQPR